MMVQLLRFPLAGTVPCHDCELLKYPGFPEVQCEIHVGMPLKFSIYTCLRETFMKTFKLSGSSFNIGGGSLYKT